MKSFNSVILLLLGGFCSTIVAQATRYVTPQGGGNLSGASWANASASLQNTINASAAGDFVFVAAGTYVGNFTLKEGVSLYGGFVAGASSLSERRLPGSGEQLTILYGNNKGRVLTQISDFEQKAVIDGFVIEGGSALSGAGVAIRSGVTLRRCIIRNNSAGAIDVGDYIAAQGGILYRLDRKTGLGYIMAVTDHGTTYPSNRGTLLPMPTLDEARLDMATDDNHKKMNNSRAAKAVTEYRAPAPADGFSDWMLPSAGDWALFVSGGAFAGQRTELATMIDLQLTQLGYTPLGTGKYWSSTAASNAKYPHMWYANLGTSSLSTMSAFQYNRIRPVRSFSLSVGSGNGGGVFALGTARIEACLVVGNSATEGSGVFAEGAVQIHYSTIADNTQNGQSSVNSEAVVMKVQAGSMEIPSLINSVVYGNVNYKGEAANLEAPQIKMYYSALESSSPVDGTGNVTLSTDIQSANYPSFADAASGDYRPMAISPLAAAADTRRLPLGLDSDLAGVLRAKGSPSSIGAFEAADPSASSGQILTAAVSVYPSALHVGDELTIRSSDGIPLRYISVTDLFGREVFVRTDALIECRLVLSQSGVYVVKVINAEGKVALRKVVVNS